MARTTGGETLRGASRLAVGLGWTALVVVALPTPFAFWHADTRTRMSWPGHQRWIMSLSKAVPLLLIYVLGMTQLFRGARWPQIRRHRV